MQRTVKSIEEMDTFAAEYLAGMIPREEKATVVGLVGDLGAGKTAFVKSLARALHVQSEVLSPTFVIAKYYELVHAPWKQLVHIDAYRIEDQSELVPLRIHELLRDPKALVVIEWPEKMGTLFPKDASRIAFTFVDEATRTITT